MNNRKPSYSEWLSFIAVLVAAVALIISAWQAYLFRSHNIISVEPLLDVEKQIKVIGYEKVIWLALRNDGLGPAIIESQVITYNKTELDKKYFAEVIKSLYSHVNYDFDLIQENVVLRPGEARKFLMFDKDNLLVRQGHERRAKGYLRFFSLDIKVHYRTLYGRKHVFSRKIGELFPSLASRLGWQLSTSSIQRKPNN